MKSNNREDLNSNNSKNKIETYGLKYFHQEFKNKYPPTMLGEKKGVRPVNVSISLYKKI